MCPRLVLWLLQNGATPILKKWIQSKNIFSQKANILITSGIGVVFIFRLTIKEKKILCKEWPWNSKLIFLIHFFNGTSNILHFSLDLEKSVILHLYLFLNCFNGSYGFFLYSFPTVVTTIMCFPGKVRLKLVKSKSCSMSWELSHLKETT